MKRVDSFVKTSSCLQGKCCPWRQALHQRRISALIQAYLSYPKESRSRFLPLPCRRYREWKAAQEPALRCFLPGRVLLLTRQPAPSGAAQPVGGIGRCCSAWCCCFCAGSGKGSTAAGLEAWEASWVTGGQLAEGGIQVSRHVIADHWASRLLGVLGDLASATAAAPGEPEAATEGGKGKVDSESV